MSDQHNEVTASGDGNSNNLPGWQDGSYKAHPEVPRDWQVPSHNMAHTPPVVSPYGTVSQSPVVYAINPYKNTTCIVAMILGIASFFTFGATGIPALIVGHIALTQCQKGTANQKGMAITGLVLGYLTVAGWTLFWLMALVGNVMGTPTGGAS